MRVVLFGATGMIGEGALIECLEDPGITAVLSLSRRPSGHTHDKLSELIHKDFADLSAIQEQLRGYDACFFTPDPSACSVPGWRSHAWAAFVLLGVLTHTFIVLPCPGALR